jgi:hypothetical protein
VPVAQIATDDARVIPAVAFAYPGACTPALGWVIRHAERLDDERSIPMSNEVDSSWHSLSSLREVGRLCGSVVDCDARLLVITGLVHLARVGVEVDIIIGRVRLVARTRLGGGAGCKCALG